MYMHAAYVRLLDLMAPKEDGKLGAIITPEAWCWRMLETPHLVWPRHLATVPEQSREGNSRAKDLGCPPLCIWAGTGNALGLKVGGLHTWLLALCVWWMEHGHGYTV